VRSSWHIDLVVVALIYETTTSSSSYMVISSWGGDAGTQSQCAQRSLSFIFSRKILSLPHLFNRAVATAKVAGRERKRTTLDIRLAFISSSFFCVFIPFLLLLLLLLVWKWKSPITHGGEGGDTQRENCTNPKTWKISLEGEYTSRFCCLSIRLCVCVGSRERERHWKSSGFQ
jgi:hypothetical protein